MFKKTLSVFIAAGLLIAPGLVSAHCEIPCGIYDDETKFKELGQHVDTIEKSVREIQELEAAAKPDMNQLVRWINNKDAHADKIKEEIANYFLSQRVKFPEKEEGREAYDRQLELLHQITVYAMKTKQTADLKEVLLLRESLGSYKELYWKIHGREHE